ncbi:DNA/RNA non-specific endonuclease [Dolosigranulum pigrum]|uniref:DNA/RNA non-specific endonuclease n=1 Tax=Dolosigranulum pigrum TaxID=29394 RepID=UPI001AD88011|nr:DNA/RNA non-specific endonuclease [Dolosigranulum pigrum]QTJ35022.1 hypothetical protein FE322_06685 [Dolosigranulum pigrum]QTJ40187.1 hypothetical protein FE325_06615 [Dolosigranulum pigrum]QTJ48670.1 hypothetical protein FE330_06660 [Dolosigranulum pigrum]
MKKYMLMALFLGLSGFLMGCHYIDSQDRSVMGSVQTGQNTDPAGEIPRADDLPLGELYIEINDNIPVFDSELLEAEEPFYDLAPLDQFGRAQAAIALLDEELLPPEQRGDNPTFEPSGWNQANYEIVSGNWLYNRSHLLGWQLTGNNDYENFITGTRQFNAEGMLPFENFVAHVVEQGMRVVYSVIPIYDNDNLVPHGVQMMGWSQDDNGETLQFNIFVPNEQAGVMIDYSDGSSYLE